MKILKTILFSMGAVQAIDMDALIAALKSNDTDALEKFNNQKVIFEILKKKFIIFDLKLTHSFLKRTESYRYFKLGNEKWFFLALMIHFRRLLRYLDMDESLNFSIVSHSTI